MSNGDPNLSGAIELAKVGFDNAQARISAIDAKVSVAVGILIVLLPAPLVVIGWFTGLGGSTGAGILFSCRHCWLASLTVACFFLAGMASALFALLKGISCLSPRGPKGYGINGPFQNEWRPNVLFPIHKPDQLQKFCEHMRQIRAGAEPAFVLSEYEHQLEQLGRILDAKFVEMKMCFWWLHACFVCYGISILISTYIGVNAWICVIS